MELITYSICVYIYIHMHNHAYIYILHTNMVSSGFYGIILWDNNL